MGFNGKLLGVGLLVLFAFGSGQNAQAKESTGQCAKYYKGIYAHAATHKAFATSNGGAPSPKFACGYSYGYGSKAEARFEAVRTCKTFHNNGRPVKSCVIIETK